MRTLRRFRARICEGLEFLGIELNGVRNAENAPLISEDSARTKVRVLCARNRKS